MCSKQSLNDVGAVKSGGQADQPEFEIWHGVGQGRNLINEGGMGILLGKYMFVYTFAMLADLRLG